MTLQELVFTSSEYIVSSYGINNLDIHFGIGWGQYSGTKKNKKSLGIYKKFILKTSKQL